MEYSLFFSFYWPVPLCELGKDSETLLAEMGRNVH